MAEKQPFDVYMVDGQMRVQCAIMAFLHAAKYQQVSLVLIHDYYHIDYSKGCKGCHNYRWQRKYHVIENIADLIDHSGGEIAVFRRKSNITDGDILDLWDTVKDDW